MWRAESTGVEKVEKQLNSEILLQWDNPSTMANAKVILSIPKFKMEKMIDPKASGKPRAEKLSLMRIHLISLECQRPREWPSQMLFKVCLEITEDGKEATEVPGS